ncbi:MAG TPA: energy transducer TonB [Gemmatimonadaceae bacterium]|nr:energy transducer TonB [Gemmatimonadaceae bacterium]
MRLLESKKTEQTGRRSPSGTIFSVILHVAVIFLAVFATANAGVRKSEKTKAENLRFMEVKKPEPPPPPKKEPPPPPKVKKETPKPKTPEPPKPKLVVQQPKVEAPAPPKGFQVVPPPVAVPTKIPSIDLSKAITNEADFSGKGVAGGTANGVKGGTGDADSKGKEAGEVKKPEEEHHGPYMEFQVEKAVERIGGASPEYPASLRDRGVQGTVVIQFVVNENGRADPGSVKVLDSTDPAFTAAVKEALPRMKFSAAQIGGKKVSQLVQMPFQFHLNR